MDKKTVVIIGAGPAGLTAAYELLENDGAKEYEVIVLEESQDIGGISKTVKYKGNRMDIGGHRFFSKDDRVMKFWSDLMPIQGVKSFDDEILGRERELAPGGPNPNTEDEVMLIRTRVSRIYYLKKFFDYPISMKWQTFSNMGFFRTMKAGFSYLKTIFVKKPETSLENFYINRFGKVLYSMFFEKYTEKLWGRAPSEISADWGAQRVKGISIKAVVKDMFKKVFGKKNAANTETSLIEQFWYPKYGPGHLCETLAKRVEEKGEKNVKGYRVTNVVEEGNREKSELGQVDENQEKVDADIVISSMPLSELTTGIVGTEVPEKVLEIAKGLPFRDFITVGVLVDKLKLENKTKMKTLGNIVPDCWIYVQEPEVKMCRIQIFNNWSPYLVQDPEHQVWIGLEYTCNEGDEYWNLSEEAYQEFAIGELMKMNLVNKEDIKDMHVEKIKKAYPAYFDTYKDIQELIDYINTYENLYCVGRNGQHRYNNMDHSMVTAMEAVKAIKENNPSKDAIWNVNTEKEYHEVKDVKEEKQEEGKK